MVLQAVAGSLNFSINCRLLSLTKMLLKMLYQVNFLSASNVQKMDLIHFEAEESQENQALTFSDNDDEMINNEAENFIDDNEQPEKDVIFYSKLDPGNIDHYYKFPNQTRDPTVAGYEEHEMYFGTEDQQPELYVPQNRESVEFDKFSGLERSVKKLKKTLQSFENSDNPFFDSIIYGVIYKMTKGKLWIKIKQDVLGNDFYGGLVEIEHDIQLARILFGYFNGSFLAKEVLEKYDFILKFLERKDQFRLLKKKS